MFVQDSTVVTLADTMARFFPGAHSKAAVKINAVSSVLSGTVRSLTIAAGKRNEARFVKISRKLAGHLLLLDLGYFSWAAFAKIDRVGAFFVSRLKANANPTVVGDFHRGPGRRHPIVGLKLRDVVKTLRRQELDVEVEVSYRQRRRPTVKGRGKTIQRRVRLRVVGVRHPDTGKFLFYVTNLAPDALEPEQVRVAYSTRWFGELLFRELKSNCQLRKMPSRKPQVVRALVIAAAIRLMVARVALDAIRQRHAHEMKRRFLLGFQDFADEQLRVRTAPERFHSVWRDLSIFYLLEVLRKAGVGWSTRHLDDLLTAAMLDPNRSRYSLWRTVRRA